MNVIESGRRVRMWMSDRHMTVEDLACALSQPDDAVSVAEIESWLDGCSSMSLYRAEQICDIFGRRLDELAGRTKCRRSASQQNQVTGSRV